MTAASMQPTRPAEVAAGNEETMNVRNDQNIASRPCVQAARDRASAIVESAVMPAFADRFPDQVADAVDTIALMQLRERGCCMGEPALA
jgi:hypothetical protein